MIVHNLMWRAAAFCVAALLGAFGFSGTAVQAAALHGQARIIDGDTLDLAGVRIRLFGIDAPEHNQNCTDDRGKRWACGTFATQTLKALTRGELSCEELDRDRYGRVVARCSVGGRDIAEQMVAQGAAFAYRRYSMDYVGVETRAEKRGLGLWSGEAEQPSDFRHANASPKPASVGAPDGCAIKGNISKSGRIYHVPGQRFYTKTSISEKDGEHWFCSEAEARAAGWRAAKQ
jgi:endonuclease YncB( thermonuclease family)